MRLVGEEDEPRLQESLDSATPGTAAKDRGVPWPT